MEDLDPADDEQGIPSGPLPYAQKRSMDVCNIADNNKNATSVIVKLGGSETHSSLQEVAKHAMANASYGTPTTSKLATVETNDCVAMPGCVREPTAEDIAKTAEATLKVEQAELDRKRRKLSNHDSCQSDVSCSDYTRGSRDRMNKMHLKSFRTEDGQGTRTGVKPGKLVKSKAKNLRPDKPSKNPRAP